MVERLGAVLGRLDEHFQVGARIGLAGELFQRVLRAQH
jgi:hypothetical protein